MSFKSTALYPANPNTTRGSSTRLSSSKNKVVYANGRSVIIRDLVNPSLSVTYAGHIQPTTVARISPSGYYCASADITGNVRVWDTVGEDQVLKGEYRAISGRINDLDWDGESKRIVAVGDGREKFGHVFMMDTGSSAGEISGHSKSINAVSMRQGRPFRAVSGGDDSQIVFYHGAPYKYQKTIKTHTKFVQDVRYSPSGDIFASVGADSKIFLYDGATGDTLDEITDSPHKGTIMAATWSPDSKSLATSSADRTVKLWDVETRKATATWTVGSAIDDQQVGNTWNGESNIVSLSLGGDLNVFDPRVGDKPSRIFQAPQKAVNAFAPSPDSDTFFAGSADGRVLSYSTASGESTTVKGDGHTGLLVDLAANKDGKVFSTGFDDKVREIGSSGFTSASLSTSSQPKSLAVSEDGYVFVAEISGVEVIKDNQQVFNLPLNWSPGAVAVYGSLVAVGDDRKVHLYDWDGKTLKESGLLEANKSVVSCIAFSPDGAKLVSGDSQGKLALFDAKEKTLITGRWTSHTARINAISWTSDSKHIASACLDTHVYIWSLEKPLKSIAMKNVHPGGANAALWIGEKNMATSGADGVVKVWEVTFHPGA